jgi:hypothetical protein
MPVSLIATTVAVAGWPSSITPDLVARRSRKRARKIDAAKEATMKTITPPTRGASDPP